MAQRPQFDSHQKFVVLRNFKFAGRLFLAGQEFPWRSLGCNVRRLSQMYSARRVSMVAAQAAVSEEALLEMEPAVKPVEKVEEIVKPTVVEPITTTVIEKPEVADTSKKAELTDEEKKAKKAARRKAARKAAKLAKEEK